jgi:hypothetical protein
MKDAEIEDFFEGFKQPTYRGMRINGVRVATWSSRDGWSGDGCPRRTGSTEKRPCGIEPKCARGMGSG